MEYGVLLKKDSRFSYPARKIKELVAGILREFGVEKGSQVEVVLVGKRKAKELNLRYRKEDYVPAVLSFPASKEGMPPQLKWLGEVVVCYSEAVEKAIRENQPLEGVLEELLRHGLVNLLRGHE